MQSLFKNLIVIVFCILAYSCTNSGVRKADFTLDSNMAAISADSIVSLFSDSAVIRLKLKAPEISQYAAEGDKSHSEFPKGMSIEFYDEKSKLVSTLRANYGIYYPNKKLWIARGKVKLKNKEGGILESEELFSDEKTQKIYSTKAVKITDNYGMSFSGAGGFESNLNFTKYEFKDVSGYMNSQGSVIK